MGELDELNKITEAIIGAQLTFTAHLGQVCWNRLMKLVWPLNSLNVDI
jgi:hypothetical protein